MCYRYGVILLVVGLLCGCSQSVLASKEAAEPERTEIKFNVVGKEPDPDRKFVCRRMLVGPWYNQPQEYEGYNGFVGWASITVLRTGRWLITFNSGYWHASLPTVGEALKEERNKKWMEDYWAKGCPRIHAPRGGRAHLMYSDDAGLTWSKPTTIVDTANTNACPNILEMNDGTLLCTFFDERLPRGDEPGCLYIRIGHIFSTDQGQTWHGLDFLPDTTSMGNEPAIQIADGTVLRVASALFDSSRKYESTVIFASENNGRTFDIRSIIGADDHHMHEPTLVEMNDGRLALLTRPKGDISWSDDKGKTWTKPVSTGIYVNDPHLLQMPNGVLALFCGSRFSGKKGVKVCLSKDNGLTWNGPGDHYGYEIDSTAYGYCCPVLLDDGTVYVVYQRTGGHNTQEARTQALWGIRVRIFDSADGIEILPAPGSPADKGVSFEVYKSLFSDEELRRK